MNGNVAAGAGSAIATRIRHLSLRDRFLLAVLFAVIVPLGLTSAWTLRSSARAAEALLRAQLEESLSSLASGIEGRWQYRHSDLLMLAGNEPVRAALVHGTALDSSAHHYLDALYLEMQRAVEGARIVDLRGAVMWQTAVQIDTAADDEPVVYAPSFAAHVPIHDAAGRDGAIGELHAAVRLNSIMPDDPPVLPGNGRATLIVREVASGAVLLGEDANTLNATAEQLERGSLDSDGERWIVVRRVLEQPQLELRAAAPLAPYTAPFRDAARLSAIALLLVVLLATLFVIMLTKRITRSLAQLADATEHVARGHLDTKVPVTSTDEVGRVSATFNTMTERLRDTLAERARRESLAAVGEFAAELAHEIRNGHTSLKLDLQLAQQSLPAEAPARPLVARGLERITRLDRTVTGALRVARSGRVQLHTIDVCTPIAAAVASVELDAARRGVTLSSKLPADGSCTAIGDAAALEQLFVNLLMNAIDAAGEDGLVAVTVECDADAINAVITDSGGGFGDGSAERAFEPFYSTKPRGTGLGLPIAKRIAEAHGGSITIEPGPGKTITTVQLRTR